MEIEYKETLPAVDTIMGFFHDSDYFPIRDKQDADRIDRMFRNADLLVTAWDGDKLVGIARSLTDFCYCCYLSDLAVRNGYKQQGIGKRLVEMTKEKAGDACKLILQSSPIAMDFYARIGMQRIDSAFIIPRTR